MDQAQLGLPLGIRSMEQRVVAIEIHQQQETLKKNGGTDLPPKKW